MDVKFKKKTGSTNPVPPTNNINTKDPYKDTSKYLSYLLRHHPPKSMDANGYVEVTEIIKLVNAKNKLKWKKSFNLTNLDELVETNNKKRFALNSDKTKIRASQGHSVQVDLGMKPQLPPKELYHGTAKKFLHIIMKDGLRKMKRQHVHLSQDLDTAFKVGSRHGKAIILTINTERLVKSGHKFYLSANGVWLTDDIPAEYLID